MASSHLPPVLHWLATPLEIVVLAVVAKILWRAYRAAKVGGLAMIAAAAAVYLFVPGAAPIIGRAAHAVWAWLHAGGENVAKTLPQLGQTLNR